MKIAGVSMTYNDDYKLKKWKEHYLTYKEQLELFIIVDNCSDDRYFQELKVTFPDAVILRRKDNGGCTAAYNDGIKYALEHTDVEAIAILGNDIKVTEKCLPAMNDYLFSDENLGIVSTAILDKDSNIISNYGHIVRGFNVTYCNKGENINKIAIKQKYTDLVSGGFTMAKREFYVKTGLQDDNLFMYCDELDTMYKARRFGFKMGVIANEYAWHWHINNPVIARRSSLSRYLICRNRIYLAKKYESIGVVLKCATRGLFLVPLIYAFRFTKYWKYAELCDAWYSFLGTMHGIFGIMNKLRLDI